MTDVHALNWEQAVQWLKDQPDQQELVRACFYDDPLLEAAERYWNSGEWQSVRELLPATGGTALDIGSGRGISAYALARDGWQTTALEPNPSALVGAGAIRNLAHESGLNIEVVEEWGEQLPFPDQTFDLVHCRQVLHHARDLEKLCGEIGRVLRRGGFFIATREHVISSKADLPKFLSSHPLHDLYGGENAFLLSEYTGAIVKGGIALTQVLNPHDSLINLFPETIEDVKRRYAGRVRWPFPNAIPDRLISWFGARSNFPGRLYTFVGNRNP